MLRFRPRLACLLGNINQFHSNLLVGEEFQALAAPSSDPFYRYG